VLVSINDEDLKYTAQCDCGDLTHVIRFYKYVWTPELDVEYGIEFLLNHYLPWHKRIIPAIKYLFGSPWVGYDSIMLQEADREKIIDVLYGVEPTVKELLLGLARIAHSDAQNGEDAMKMRNIATALIHPEKKDIYDPK
jgi:hypothetical protein